MNFQQLREMNERLREEGDIRASAERKGQLSEKGGYLKICSGVPWVNVTAITSNTNQELIQSRTQVLTFSRHQPPSPAAEERAKVRA